MAGKAGSSATSQPTICTVQGIWWATKCLHPSRQHQARVRQHADTCDRHPDNSLPEHQSRVLLMSARLRKDRHRGPAARIPANQTSAGRAASVEEIFPAPRPFWWLPVAGQRHAIDERDRHTDTGALVHTLCGTTYQRPSPPPDADWFWRTCEPCWRDACTIVELM